MDKFWEIVIIIFLACCIVTDIIYIIIRFIKLIKCRKIKECKNRKCLVNGTCGKYSELLTQEEYDSLIELIEKSFPKEGENYNNQEVMR